MGLPIPVIPLELPSYQRKENFGADETFFNWSNIWQSHKPKQSVSAAILLALPPWAFGIGMMWLRSQIFCSSCGIEVNVTAPMGATPSDIAQMGKAHFNVLLVSGNW